MGSGLSMTSVNKIKELAEQREYSLALEIVDSQDLTKSLNPQFLRICGEIYIKTNRLKDARRVLLMAHKLAPEGKRVIYTLTYLYLKMGYKELARRYYDLYLFDADENNSETKQIKYIFKKANKCDIEELESLLCPYYIHNLDYDWSFEAFLLLVIQNKKDDAKILASDFCATYKNSEYSRIIEAVLAEKDDARVHFYIFPEKVNEDNEPEQEELRQEEAVLLEADDLRIHPKEAEITIMVDDDEEVDVGTKRKLKKFLKNQEKQKSEENSDNPPIEEDLGQTETVIDEAESISEDVDTTEKQSVKGLFKKVFSKKKKQQEESWEDALEEAVSNDDNQTDENVDLNVAETEGEKEQDLDIADTVEEVLATDEIENEKDTDKNVSETEDIEAVNSIVESEVEETEDIDDIETEDGELDADDNDSISVSDAGLDFESDGEASMREIHTKKHNSIVSIDFDDNDFNAESDTIEGLSDEDFGNPFESISAFKKEKEEPVFVPKRKTEFMFEDIDFSSDEDEEDFDIDDFSSKEDDEFGEMKSNLDKIFEDADSEEDDVSNDDISDNTEDEAEINLEFLDDVDTESEASYELELEETEEEISDTEEFNEDEIESEISDIDEADAEEFEADALEEAAEEYADEAETEEKALEEAIEEYADEADVDAFEPEEIEAELEETEEEISDTEEFNEEEIESEISDIDGSDVEEFEADALEEATEEYADEAETEAEALEEATEEYADEADVDASEPEEIEAELEETEEEISDAEEFNEEEIESEISDIDGSDVEEFEAEALEEATEKYAYEAETEVGALEEVTEEYAYEADMDASEPEEIETELGETEEENSVIEEVNKEESVAKPAKKTLDYPVFRSSLFPNHNREVTQVKNNFNEIMTEAQDKIQENLLKEEQMQREAEALLASLGIDLNSITVTSDSIESINNTLYNEPSRDELKASLRIDSVKKNIIRKLREYR